MAGPLHSLKYLLGLFLNIDLDYFLHELTILSFLVAVVVGMEPRLSCMPDKC